MALSCLPHAVSGAWEMEGICLASGAAYKWFRDTLAVEEREMASRLGLDTYTILNAAAESAPPGCGGTILLPTFAGSGAPHWDPSVRGVMLGLSLTTDKKTLARAVLEGVCFEIRWMLEAVKGLGMKLDRLHVYGGAAKSRLWNQIGADIYGLPISRPEVEEGGLVGAAICAGVGIGLFKDATEGAESMIRIRESYQPNPKLRAMYDEMFEIYKDAYLALSNAGIFRRLASVVQDTIAPTL